MKQGGSIANHTGQGLETFIENALIRQKYHCVRSKDFLEECEYKKPIYATQYFIGDSIYENKLYCDFIVYHPEKHPLGLVIESKWQQAAGSVDEKFPFLVANINQIYPCKTIVLLDGGGYKSGAEKWIRSQVNPESNLIGVFNMSEFQIWVNKGGI